jgi:hypothetical protein
MMADIFSEYPQEFCISKFSDLKRCSFTTAVSCSEGCNYISGTHTQCIVKSDLKFYAVSTRTVVRNAGKFLFGRVQQ